MPNDRVPPIHLFLIFDSCSWEIKVSHSQPSAGALLEKLRTDEADGRHLIERLASALQGALLVRHALHPVADAFCATRLDGDWRRAFGTLPRAIGHGIDPRAAPGPSARKS